MSRESVLCLLERFPEKWFSSDEIRRALRINRGSVCSTLVKLRRTKEVRFMVVEVDDCKNRPHNRFLYKCNVEWVED